MKGNLLKDDSAFVIAMSIITVIGLIVMLVIVIVFFPMLGGFIGGITSSLPSLQTVFIFVMCIIVGLIILNLAKRGGRAPRVPRFR